MIQLDETTLKALNRIAPAVQRKRAEFVRKAIKDAIRRQEFERMQEAYRRQPDSATDADDWAFPEEWKRPTFSPGTS